MKLKIVVIATLVLAIALGVFFWTQGRVDLTAIEGAIPDRPPAEGMPSILAQRIEKSDAAARNGPDRLAAFQELSRLYHANGYYQEAWSCYNGLIAAEPNNPLWPYRLASIVAGYGQLEQAVPLYRRSLELDGDYMPVYIRLGDALIKQNLPDEAKPVYQRALDRQADNPYALVGMARVAIASEDWQTARVHLENAIKATSFSIGADLLGDVYEHLGLDTQHEIVMRNIKWGSYADIPDPRMLSMMDDSYDPYQVSVAGGWAVHQGDIETGLRYIRRAVELSPNDSNLQYQIAQIYAQQGRQSEAERHYKRCVELEPTFADAWLALINYAKQSNNPATARRMLDTALRNAPQSPSLHIEKGDEYLKAGRIDLAMTHFQKSIELRPHEASGYIQLARAYLHSERVEEGVEQMRLALKVEPSNAVAMTTLALHAIDQRDLEVAEEWLQRLTANSRITDRETNALYQRFQSQFGRAPRVR